MAHTVDRIALKSPMPGTERFLTVHRFGTPGARPKVYMQAALHADEWPGLMALHHLIPRLSEADAAGQISGEVIVLPYANPIGLTQRLGGAAPGRYAFDGTGNYNRNWPDLSSAAAEHLTEGLSGDLEEDVERVRRALQAAVHDVPKSSDTDHWRATLLSLCIDADITLDIHCDQESLAHIYCNETHEAHGRALAEAIDSPVVMLESEAGGFSFDDALAGVWRRLKDRLPGGDALPPAHFACTLELRGKDDISDELGAQDAAGIIRYLAWAGVVSGGIPARPDDSAAPYKLEEVDVIGTDTGGLIAFKAAIGDRVTVGQPIAEIIDLAAEDPRVARTVLVSRTDGLFFARTDLRLVEPGTSIAKVAGRARLAHRKVGALLDA